MTTELPQSDDDDNNDDDDDDSIHCIPPGQLKFLIH